MLRLLARGHDIKSIAGALSISTSAANERLRSARRKLGVSSSREAARVLAAEEGHDFSVDRKIGVTRQVPGLQHRPSVFVWIGVAMTAAIALSLGLMSLAGSRPPIGASPTVVRTNPPPGAVIAPGQLKLSVTFDRPMRAGNFSFVQKDPATYPNCGRNVPAQSKDGRTFTLECTVDPGKSYEMWFNSPPYMNFKALDGTPAVPFQLEFRTSTR